MSLLDDPSMKEIVDGFCEESNELLGQLEDALDILEDDPSNTAQLEQFGQIIDRVMGAAKSIGADEIATFCELGKVIGYKSSQTDDLPLLNVVVAVLFDAVDLLEKMVEKLQTGSEKQLEGLNTKAFVSRLNWLSSKFKDIERASVTYKKEGVGAENNLSQNSIDDLMASLGL